MRFSKHNAFDTNILLMIDEIYLFKRVEATDGQVFGLPANLMLLPQLGVSRLNLHQVAIKIYLQCIQSKS